VSADEQAPAVDDALVEAAYTELVSRLLPLRGIPVDDGDAPGVFDARW